MVGGVVGDPCVSHAEADAEKHHEIVIVRHGHGDHDDGHHGGVWKIAFADFMTAMMCFFLVMWLINASNEQTKAAVASYFNPVKLIDRNASRKGLEDVGDGPLSSGNSKESTDKQADGNAKAEPSENKGAIDSVQEGQHADEKLFADPYAVLAEIAAETGLQQNVSEKGAGGAQDSGPATGASGGDAYRDPFAPDFWSEQVATPSEAQASAEIPKAEAGEGGLDPVTAPAAEAKPAPEQAQAKPVETQGETPPETIAAQQSPEETAQVADAKVMQPEAKTADAKAHEATESKVDEAKADEAKALETPKPETHEPSQATIAAADQIRQELAEALLPGDRMRDGISVVATDKGVRVSVTDQLDFGMFEIGAATPRRELVLAMEKIAKAISAQKGNVTISGHTDARPFKSGTYDNWRLSTARAHSAYYMLARAGLDEKRIVEVAGFADRNLKEPQDPLAAINRRIEILLEIPQ